MHHNVCVCFDCQCLSIGASKWCSEISSLFLIRCVRPAKRSSLACTKRCAVHAEPKSSRLIPGWDYRAGPKGCSGTRTNVSIRLDVWRTAVIDYCCLFPLCHCGRFATTTQTLMGRFAFKPNTIVVRYSPPSMLETAQLFVRFSPPSMLETACLIAS